MAFSGTLVIGSGQGQEEEVCHMRITVNQIIHKMHTPEIKIDAEIMLSPKKQG